MTQHAQPKQEPGPELDPLRTAALGLLYTAPLVGFTFYGVMGLIGSTAWGGVVLWLPGAIGACLLAWSRFSARRPRPGVIVAALTLVAGAMLWLAFSGAVDGDGDGIAGGFLVLSAIAYGAIAFRVALVINTLRFG